MVQWSEDILTRYGAPGLYGFNRADLADLRPEFPEANHWMANRFLNFAMADLFGKRLKEPWHRYELGLVSRSQAFFRAYHASRDATAEYLDKTQPGNPDLERYFGAIYQFEACLLHYSALVQLHKAWMEDMGRSTPGLRTQAAFTAGDGSADESAYRIANAIKHWGQDLRKQRPPHPSCTFPLWLANDGLHSSDYELSYERLTAITRGVAEFAEGLTKLPAAMQS